jgi:hypothetical protein
MRTNTTIIVAVAALVVGYAMAQNDKPGETKMPGINVQVSSANDHVLDLASECAGRIGKATPDGMGLSTSSATFDLKTIGTIGIARVRRIGAPGGPGAQSILALVESISDPAAQIPVFAEDLLKAKDAANVPGVQTEIWRHHDDTTTFVALKNGKYWKVTCGLDTP